MNNSGTRTTLIIGAAVVAAGGLASVVANAQAPAAPAIAPAPETPRGPDGKPVLQGMWVNAGPGAPSGSSVQNYNGRGGTFVGLEADGAIRRTSNDNMPLYKPEYWDRITYNDYMGNWDDPVSSCYPLGVPRSGAPHQIVKVEGQPAYILVYQSGFNGYNGSYRGWNEYRWIWTDGRARNQNSVAFEGFNGDSIGHWEGDTLVIETIGFSDETWLHKNGWIHGFNMKVTERLTRVSNSLVWEATVEDPEFMLEPWKMSPMVARFTGQPTSTNYVPESRPCLVREPYGSHTRSG
jgi:hypothetical protein